MRTLDHLCKPLIIAHGGSKQLFPENTMPAFDGSAALGVDALEIDVRLTKDGVLVAHHDAAIDRTSNGQGAVADYTYEELKIFNFAYRFQDLDGNFPYRRTYIKIPKLIDIIQKYSHYLIILDMKDKGRLGEKASKVLKQMLDAFKLPPRLMVSSFDYKTIRYFRKITGGKVMTGASRKESIKYYFAYLFHLSGLISHTPYEVVQIPTKVKFFCLADKKYIESLQKRNIGVQFWTINNKDEMKALIKLNADGIITDRPDLMNQVLDELSDYRIPFLF